MKRRSHTDAYNKWINAYIYIRQRQYAHISVLFNLFASACACFNRAMHSFYATIHVHFEFSFALFHSNIHSFVRSFILSSQHLTSCVSIVPVPCSRSLSLSVHFCIIAVAGAGAGLLAFFSFFVALYLGQFKMWWFSFCSFVIHTIENQNMKYNAMASLCICLDTKLFVIAVAISSFIRCTLRHFTTRFIWVIRWMLIESRWLCISIQCNAIIWNL